MAASLYALGAMALTVLLVPFLPGRRDGEQAGCPCPCLTAPRCPCTEGCVHW
jgi:hypothetical protein